VVIVASDRGLFRSTDGGERWVALVDNLPAPLEAGPLVPDPSDPERLYAGFAVTPYSELWRRAVDGAAAWRHIDMTSLLGAVALLVLVGVLSVAAVWWLWRHRRAAPIR